MKKIVLAALLLTTLGLHAQPFIQLTNYATGFQQPVAVRHAGDERLFVVQQNGIIRIIDGEGQTLPVPFMNIDPRVGSGSERGLLGLAFHPNYLENGYFYVNYTDNSGTTKISRFSVTANPNIADPDSEFVVMSINQPYSNHNGGDLHFGPDGYLYIGMGDGGSGGDPENRSQNPTSLLGKMLRIDVDNGSPYSIPESNPFFNSTSTAQEIWALGVRNPWRFSFDRLTGDMWIGDVGQNVWEEVDFQPAASVGGENYGWRCYEGNVAYNTNGCGPAGNYVAPVAVYNHSSGCSITGGYVYRGSEYPYLYGHYLYTDYCTGRIWSLYPNGAGGFTNVELANLTNNDFSGFGEDVNGELYITGLGTGIIYKITELCSTLSVVADVTDVSCFGLSDGNILLGVSGGTAPYNFDWSAGSGSNLPPGTYAVTATDALGCSFQIDSIVVNEPAAIVATIEVDGATLTAPAGFANYQWFLDDEPIPDANDAVYVALETGAYHVQISDANGCSATSESVDITINSLPADLGLERVRLSPNPFRENFRLELDVQTSGNCHISIFDAEGRVLQSFSENIAGRWSRRISTAGWPAGLYLVRIEKDGKQLSYPVQKQ